MTVNENGNEEAGGIGPQPKLASISTKGLFASLRERGDDVASTPDSSGTPSSRGRALASGRMFSPGRSASPAGKELNPLRTSMGKFLTPSRTFVRLRDEKEELSRLTPSPPSHGFADSFKLPLIGEVKPKYLFGLAKQWLKSPKNCALLIWGIAVAISGAILFMVMVGMLNAVLPAKSTRNTWFEVSNQTINALFTLMVLYVHPTRCLHLYMLYRWKASDIVKLRNVYCKNGTRKPHEWGHMLVVVMLLQLNCFAQYALCGLNWGYRRAKRPALGVALTLCLSFGGAAAAGIYNNVSPLGKDFEVETEDPDDPEKAVLAEAQSHEFVPRTRIYRMLERRVSFAYRDEGVLVEYPDWKGGLFDVRMDPTVSILSTLCCVCVFGWNMERLGFGNRFVHIITFVLICTAPFWIFDLAALNITNRVVRNALGGTGIALCVFGLLYGGYWRIQIRERFKLPGNKFCCHKPNITDCFLWLFCPICSLCQEVRTAEYYDIKDDRFYVRNPYIGSPPPGIASPHTPAATLAAVKELPDSMSEMNLVDVELRGHDSPYRGSPAHPRSPLAPPEHVTATRNINGLPTGMPVRGSSPLQPSDATHTSATNNPFLQPNVFSRGASPLRSPQHSSSNPFTQVELTSQASEALLRSPMRSPHGTRTPTNPFTPDTLSPAGELSSSPLPRASPSHNPFYQPDMSHPAGTRSPPYGGNQSGPSNPFLQPHLSGTSDSVSSSTESSSRGRA